MTLIVKPFELAPNCRYSYSLYDKIKMATATVCKELGLQANLSLVTLWKIEIAEEDKESFIQLVCAETHRAQE